LGRRRQCHGRFHGAGDQGDRRCTAEEECGAVCRSQRNERALRFATLISGCKPFASAGSFAASREDAHKEASEYLRRCNEEALSDLRTTNMERRQLAKDRFALASELTAILCREEEAELLRRRGRAANAA
jgi:hypothetical protein